MIEKLLENWLDNASELSYQPVFVQMLAADGYTILHSTRHCLLEFGKDILAIGPDGIGCAFQLKGDPGGRMTVGLFRREIQPQLVQLMGQSPSYPGFPRGAHRAYLVSNGQFEEEVQAAAREMNQSPYPARLELWSRGLLLDLCKRHGARLWPSEIKDNRALLEVYMANPRGQLPVQVLSGMLSSVLHLDPESSSFSRDETIRAASSAAWLTGIAISTFAEAENHQAVAHGWALCCAMMVGAAEKHMCPDAIRPSLELAKQALLDSLAALWEEVRGRKYLVEGDVFTDPEIYGWRIGVLMGLLASFAIADESLLLIDDKSREELREWLKSNNRHVPLWGESVVANLLPWLVWLRKEDATSRPDSEILALTQAVITHNQTKSNEALPSPYYGFDEILLNQLQLAGRLDIARETFAGSAYTAEILMHLLARTNLKQSCKMIWPSFTKLAHRSLLLDESWQYCILHASSGVEVTRMYPSTYEWPQLRKEALCDKARSGMPHELHNNPWLLSMWWQVAPHRVTSEAVRIFVNSVNPRWGT